ncbi:hypothetical protein I2491_02280 [Levilactobacillus brevis]|nr:hypothetical protein AZI09_00130 [Levilactobacillus brevis]ARN96685.1 hypothetical protein AZI10_00130 [Levilactobacillus brevis]MBT9676293.1 hypothetical protein [Levilactobacillus brevis]MBY7145607.1 hypothetical protein [Levilactobacillus brevis]RDF84149.1 hypothetical protein DQM16_09580 [Levilactobacillus brevis]
MWKFISNLFGRLVYNGIRGIVTNKREIRGKHMKKRTRGITGIALGLVAGGLLFSQVPQNRSTVTDSVVKPASGQTAVQLTDTTGKGHVAVKTQTTTSQAGKTVSRETTTMTGRQSQDVNK